MSISCWGKKRKWATLTRLPTGIIELWMCYYVWHTEASLRCFAYVVIVPGRSCCRVLIIITGVVELIKSAIMHRSVSKDHCCKDWVGEEMNG